MTKATKLTTVCIQDTATDEIFRIRVTDWDTDKAVKLLKSIDDYDNTSAEGWLRVIRAKAYLACKRAQLPYSDLPFDADEIEACWSGHYDLVELEEGDKVTDVGPLGTRSTSTEESSPSVSEAE